MSPLSEYGMKLTKDGDKLSIEQYEGKPLGVARRDIKAGEWINVQIIFGKEVRVESKDIEFSEIGRRWMLEKFTEKIIKEQTAGNED
jgi:hypothetical protein